MGNAWPIIKREFTEIARTKVFIIGTLLGPVLIALLFVLPMWFMKASGGGERSILVLDATGSGVGEQIAAALNTPLSDETGILTRFVAESRAVSGEAAAERRAARERVVADGSDLDGYLYLPADLVEGAPAAYEGRNATSVTQMAMLREVTSSVVRSHRLRQAGIDEGLARQAMARVTIDARKPGSEDAEGTGAETAMIAGFFMIMIIYFAVILFATAVMRGVLEEKRDKVVEVLMSSVKAKHLMFGKVVGIGSASLFQMGVWVGFAALGMMYAPQIAAALDAPVPDLPEIPARVAVAYLFFFATGFLLYAAMFGAAGAMATSEQEANQLQFPVTIPLMIGMFMAYGVMVDADSPIAVAGTLIPFTAPMVVPFRSMMTEVPMVEYIVAAVLMIATVLLVMWAAAKIYRIGMLSTGKKPTMGEVIRWLRTA